MKHNKHWIAQHTVVKFNWLLLIFARTAFILFVILRWNSEIGNSSRDTWSGRIVVVALFVTLHPVVCVAPAREVRPVSVYISSSVNRSRGFLLWSCPADPRGGGRRARCFSSSHFSGRGMSPGRRRVWPLVCFLELCGENTGRVCLLCMKLACAHIDTLGRFKWGKRSCQVAPQNCGGRELHVLDTSTSRPLIRPFQRLTGFIQREKLNFLLLTSCWDIIYFLLSVTSLL